MKSWAMKSWWIASPHIYNISVRIRSRTSWKSLLKQLRWSAGPCPFGPPGLGKTTMALVIANELCQSQVDFRSCHCHRPGINPQWPRAGDPFWRWDPPSGLCPSKKYSTVPWKIFTDIMIGAESETSRSASLNLPPFYFDWGDDPSRYAVQLRAPFSNYRS